MAEGARRRRERRPHLKGTVLTATPVMVLAAGLVVAAVAHSDHQRSSIVHRVTTSAPLRTTSVPEKAPAGKARAVDEGAGTETVALGAVIDPATPATSLDGPGAHNRLVVVSVTVTDTGATEVQGDLSLSTSLLASDRQTYSPWTGSASQCADANGAYRLSPHSQRQGCVVFDVPSASRVVKVIFSPNDGLSGKPVQWRLGR